MLHQRHLIARVVDDEVSGEADLGRFSSQQPGAQRVECRDPHASAVGAEKSLDARAHLPRCFVGESDGEDTVGLCESVADEVRNAMSNDTRLARPCAGQNEEGTLGFENSLALFRIEP